MMASCSILRICASVAATASTHVRLALRNIQRSATSARAARWTSAPVGGGGSEGPGSSEESAKYGANRMLQGKLPLCAEMCSTKSLLAGDGEIIAQIYKERVIKRGYGSGAWGWMNAYRA